MTGSDKVKLVMNGVSGDYSWDEIFKSAQKIASFFREVQKRFIERDELIKTLKYAFLLQEHILVYGDTGTAKTSIVDTIVRNIEGAKPWSMDFSQQMGETKIYGDIDAKTAMETGRQFHFTDGSLLEANFANLGEFLDANVGLLRSLLRVLNERQFIRGPQQLKVPLMTAMANTNIDPRVAKEKYPNLEAVLDRFLFWLQVEYVKTPENRLEMLRLFKKNVYQEPLPPLAIFDVQLVSQAVLQLDLLSNEFILRAYEELARTFQERRGRKISDRRLNKGLQIMDASAILDGSNEVDWDDLDRTALVFVDHEDEQEMFQQILQEVKTKWQDNDLQTKHSQEEMVIQSFLDKMPNLDLDQATESDLVNYRRNLNRLKSELLSFSTASSAGATKRQQVIKQIEERLDASQKKIDQI